MQAFRCLLLVKMQKAISKLISQSTDTVSMIYFYNTNQAIDNYKFEN